MVTLTDLTLEEAREELSHLDIPAYKISQIYGWLYKGTPFSEMSNLSNSLRKTLSERYIDIPVVIKEKYKSKDGTIKFLFELADKNLIEGVLMNYKYGNTICISTQVGCRMGCAFCASGINGLYRNLSTGEILGQVIAVNKFLGGNVQDRKITNIVLMGSGEPLDNYENVLKFLKIVTNEKGLNVGARNISLSTCGIVPKMVSLAEEFPKITLTVSLHNPFNEERKELMPISKSYSVEDVVKAAKTYFEKSGRRVCFEYTLIKGVNDSKEHIDKLCSLLKGFPTHINCIILNKNDNNDLHPTSRKDGEEFVKKLTERKMSATLRRQMGSDIEGACGQLRNKFMKNKANLTSDKKA